jgi:hypothetical protein
MGRDSHGPPALHLQPNFRSTPPSPARGTSLTLGETLAMIIQARFGNDSLTFTSREDGRSEVYAYGDHPDVFGHPRFLMADFDKSEALVRDALRKLVGRWQVIAPKIEGFIDRQVTGGLTEIDRRSLGQIFTHGGAREFVLKNA